MLQKNRRKKNLIKLKPMKKILIVFLIISMNSCNSKKNEDTKENKQTENIEILKDKIEGKFQLINSNNEINTTDNLVITKLESDSYFLKFIDRKLNVTTRKSGNVLIGQAGAVAVNVEFSEDYNLLNLSAGNIFLVYRRIE